MDGREEIRRRLTAFDDELGRLLQSEFPYEDAKDAFQRLRDRTRSRLLNEHRMGASPNATGVAELRVEVLQFLHFALKAAGRVLRATNVRNPLELQRPLRRLAETLIRPSCDQDLRGLLLASEWTYAPHSVSSDPALRGFVVIGLPAHESSNALLIPLAGHELGHTLLRWSKIPQSLTPMMEKHLDAVLRKGQEPTSGVVAKVSIGEKKEPNRLAAVSVATRYVTELFCDLIGVGMFGSAYLRSFAYLFAPGGRVDRSDSHPATASRVRQISKAAQSWGIPVPSDFVGRFADSPESGDITPLDPGWTRIVDDAIDAALDDIRDAAKAALDRAGISPPSDHSIENVRKRFRIGVPIERAGSLASILVAAWDANDAPERELPPALPDAQRSVFLNDLALKSIEILDYEQTLAEARARREKYAIRA